jgi:hypothetical protein
MKLKKLIDIENINPRFIFWLFVVFLLVGIAVFPLFITKPDTSINKTPIVTQIEYVKVFVTPTPDGINYFPNEYQSGIRKINRPFSWIRADVSGYKDMKVTATVYDYLFFDKLHWFNPTDYKYYEQIPYDSNNKFLLVFFNIYMDDIIGEDTRLWLPNKNMFNVQVRDMLYSPIPYAEQIRFKELEDTYNLNNVERIKAYGQYRSYLNVEETRKTAGEISVKDYYLRGGKSNAQDGYIIFEVPKKAEAEDIKFRASFYSFGWSEWKLTE